MCSGRVCSPPTHGYRMSSTTRPLTLQMLISFQVRLGSQVAKHRSLRSKWLGRWRKNVLIVLCELVVTLQYFQGKPFRSFQIVKISFQELRWQFWCWFLLLSHFFSERGVGSTPFRKQNNDYSDHNRWQTSTFRALHLETLNIFWVIKKCRIGFRGKRGATDSAPKPGARILFTGPR